jgi:hypothetical protein
MENKDISKIIAEKIQKDSLKPKPRFGFIIRKRVNWIIMLLIFIAAVLSAAIILYLMNYREDGLAGSGIAVFLGSLPYFWFFVLAFLLLICGYLYSKTLFGYRYGKLAIAFIIIGIVAIFGIMGFWSGLGRKTEMIISKDIPFYRNHLYDKDKIWSNPQNGLIAGDILSINENMLFLRDLQGDEWQVDYSSALVKRRAVMEIGEKIKIIGKQTSSGHFIAREIKPWVGMMERSGMMR